MKGLTATRGSRVRERVVKKWRGYIGPACKISPPPKEVCIEQFSRQCTKCLTFLSRFYYLTFILPFSMPRSNLPSGPCISPCVFFSPFFSNNRQSNFDDSQMIRIRGDDDTITTKKSCPGSIAFNACPFVKVKQHLRKLDRFRYSAIR